MATIIDALVTTISLDPKAYKQGEKEVQKSNKAIRDDIRSLEDQIASVRQKSTKDTAAQDKAQIGSYREVIRQKRRGLEDNRSREIEQLKRTKEQTAALDTMKGAAVELFAAFGIAGGVGAFAKFVINMGMADAATGRFADNLGEDALAVNAFGAVVEQLGGKAEDARAAFANLAAIRFAMQAKGDYSMAPVLSRLGVSPQDLNDLDAAMRKIAATAKTMPKAQFYQFAHAAGFADSAINALELGDVELAKRIEEAKKREALTPEQIRRNQDLQRGGATVGGAFRGFVRRQGDEYADQFGILGDLVRGDFGKAAKDYKDSNKKKPAQVQLFSDFVDALGLIKKPAAAPSGKPAPAAAGAPAAKTGNGSAADRNNNPGNLTDGQGRLLHFSSLDEGVAAMKRQILRDFAHGQNTVSSLINDPNRGWSNEWAKGNSPASTRAYINSVAKALGVDPNQRTNFADPAVLNKLVRAMNAVERGGPSIIDPGLVNGARSLAATQHGPVIAKTATVTNDVQIGKIEVTVPPGSDGNAIATSTAAAVRHQSFVAMANTGLA